MTTWAVTAVGLATVLFVLVDMFHTLANPGALGRLSQTMLRLAWHVSRRSRLSGPFAMLAVVVIWGIIAVLGWAAVYWPHMGQGFSSSSAHGTGEGVVDAIYVSMVTISTLGFGDVFPTSMWLRLINPLEALFGFALLTVAVSWVLQVFPTLTRRRELAVRLSQLDSVGLDVLLADLESAVLHDVLDDLATDVARVRIDLRDYPETYYFREQEPVASLASTLPVAVRLSHLATRSPDPQVRHGGAMLAAALDDLAHVLDGRFLQHGGTTDEVLESFRVDHRTGHLPEAG